MRELSGLHLLQTITRLVTSAQRAIRFLLLVFHLDLREVYRDGLQGHGVSASISVGREARYQTVGEGHLQVVLLILAGLTRRQGRVLDVFAVGALQEQLRTSLAHVHHEVEVVHLDLASAAAAAERKRAGLLLAEGKRQDLDLVLVFGVIAFSFNAVYLQEIIYHRHTVLLSLSLFASNTPKTGHSWKSPAQPSRGPLCPPLATCGAASFTSAPKPAAPPPSAGIPTVHPIGSGAAETPWRD